MASASVQRETTGKLLSQAGNGRLNAGNSSSTLLTAGMYVVMKKHKPGHISGEINAASSWEASLSSWPVYRGAAEQQPFVSLTPTPRNSGPSIKHTGSVLRPQEPSLREAQVPARGSQITWVSGKSYLTWFSVSQRPCPLSAWGHLVRDSEPPRPDSSQVLLAVVSPETPLRVSETAWFLRFSASVSGFLTLAARRQQKKKAVSANSNTLWD